MSETVLQVCTMKDPLCAQGVEHKLLATPGVQHAHTNAVNGTTTVHYDEKTVTLADLEAVVDDCGLRCHGESLPLHYGGHVVHSMPAEAELDHKTVKHVVDEHTDHEMAHDHGAAETLDHSAHVGHAGMTMADMARDMRNRFLVSFVLTIPIFLYSPAHSMSHSPASSISTYHFHLGCSQKCWLSF